jgi:hypothetical protein
MKIAKTLLAVCGLIVLTTGAVPACTFACIGLLGTCQQCVDTGSYTGDTCFTSNCHCIFMVNACEGPGLKNENEIAAWTAPADQGAVCPAAEAESGIAVQF